MPTEQTFPIPVATVHQKHQKHHQRHSPKHLEDSTSRGGTARNTQSRLHSGGGGGGTGVQYAYQKKRNDGWQQQHQQHIHQQHPGRPRSGSHNTSGSGNSQYSGGSFSPPGMNFFPQMHYQQQYSDVSSVYSCSTPQPPPGGGVGDPDQRGGPPPQNVPHRQLQPQFLPNDHYGRQHHLLYQQYALQARHTQQMQALQQQQESQRRRLEQQQHHQAHSLIPELSHGPSFESGGGAMGPGGTFPPLSPNMQPLPSPLLPPPLPPSTSSEYQYAALSSAMGNMFPGERGGPSLQQNPHELEEEQS